MTTDVRPAADRRFLVRVSPAVVLLAVLAIALAGFAASLSLALNQPWMGLSLAPAQDGTVIITEVADPGGHPLLRPGAQVGSVATPDGDAMALEAVDVIEEPDTLPYYGQVNDFRERQTALSAIVASPQVVVTIVDADFGRQEVDLSPRPARDPFSLPFEYWLQVLVGTGGLLIGGVVWALRMREQSALYLFLTGLGLMASALAASVYSTRELALQGDVFRVLSAVNHAGTSGFGAALVCLFLVYPQRLVPGWVCVLVWAGTFAVWLTHLLQLLPIPSMGVYGLVVVHFVLIVGLAGFQTFLSRRDPVGRAALGWFGLSIVVGTGVFVVAIALPTVLGFEPQMSQGQSFGIIFLIYVGLALGIARYRLFDLGLWSFRLGSYLLGAMLLLGLDAVLVYVVAIERIPALGLSLLAVAMAYLPLRNALGLRLAGGPGLNQRRFRDIVDIALARRGEVQIGKWAALLEETFRPLSVERVGHGLEHARLVEDGTALIVPGPPGLPALSLNYAGGGRRLFSLRDVDRAQDLVELMIHAIESRTAHEQGVREERSRIARDLHDNIGAQLQRTLQLSDSGRKDVIVGQTLTDLRDIISNAQGAGIGLEEILAELRYETSERAEAAGLVLHWEASCRSTRAVSAKTAHTLRSIVREAASNTIRHAEARSITIGIEEDAGRIALVIADDGNGQIPKAGEPGHGLHNIAARVADMGGEFSATGTDGTRIEARFPVEMPASDQ
ncbi:sensor histidine kinase [Pelagibacterium montanilacus]|uniref:sensor histidine kinase n=1 Tax=Pelagibacterium montanilacus TaxID=2185280 RepID=UPI000F8E0A4A|nr:ATP-binding protein [Pelagibacterium montanilacus]